MGDKNFRLPDSIRPTRYRFHLVPDLGAGTFTARGEIDLKLHGPTTAITMHAVALDVDWVGIAAGPDLGHVTQFGVTSDADSQTLTFWAPGGLTLPAGEARVSVEYKGLFHKDLRGFYLAGGIGVTQFEAADARRVFPCFDEPPFKASWEISLEVPEGPGMAAISNGPVIKEETRDGKRVTTFAPTKPISSYLVAMVVGKLVATSEAKAGDVPIRTWSVPDKAHLTRFAQECASSVLPLLEQYFDYEYAFTKVDQVGVPDFEAGAMENVGCITYREIALLVDEAKAPLGVRKRVAEVITHELAHQWFGNLVTMQWWDDLWLNEAFATWMAYKIVDQWKPEWRMWDDFEGGKAEALHLDALESTHPIRSEVRNADEATENFDAITYEKGGAMLRMIEGYLGEDTFRAGIRAYMRKHTWGNTIADDLWNALAEASKQPITELANGWIGRSGYPLVELKLDGNKVHLSQRRFHADPERFRTQPDQPWPVPVVVKWADDAGVHESRMLLRDREGVMTLDAKGSVKFACGNRGGAGFYRVKYDEPSLAMLRDHATALSPVEKSNLVADSWALFRAGAAPLAPLLDLLFALAREKDYVVLGEVVGRLDGLERRCATAADRPRLRKLIAEAFTPQLAEVSWDAAQGEADATRLRRATVVRALAIVAREPSAVNEAAARVRRSWQGDATALDPNLLDSATVATTRAGDAALFDEVLSRKASEPDPASKRRYLVALGSFEESALADRVIGLLLDDAVPMQDITTYVNALLGNDAIRDRAFDHIRSAWPRVHEKSKPPMITRRMIEALGHLVHRRAEVESFFDAEAATLSAAPQAIKQTRERLRLDEDALRRAERELTAWLNR